jgi:hypothetical protein
MTGARCLAHNATLKDANGNRLSADTSTHVGGHGSDGYFDREIAPGKWEPISSQDVALAAIKSGLFGGVGYLLYLKGPTKHVHLDERSGPTKIW